MRPILATALLLLAACHDASSGGPPSAALARLAESRFVSVETIGRSVGGRPIEAVVAADPAALQRGAPRVLVVCGQHGNEPVAPRAALRILGDLAVGRHPEILERAVTVVVPFANPDGLASGRRGNAAGVDLNRDWRARTQPETRALFDAFLRWHPMLVIDAHEWSPGDTHDSNSVEVPLFASGEASPGWAHPLNQWVSAALDGCAQRGVYVQRTHWSPSNNPRLLHRHLASAWQVPAILYETMPAGAVPGTARVVAAATFLTQILGAAASSAPAPPPSADAPAPEPSVPVWPGHVALVSGLLVVLLVAQGQAPGSDAPRPFRSRVPRRGALGRLRLPWRARCPCRRARRAMPSPARRGRFGARAAPAAPIAPRRRG